MPGPERLYDAHYYQQHCGPEPYGRTKPWLDFFNNLAETMIRTVAPSRVFDAGCAWGLLVEAFRDRGVEAWGLDISPFAIGQVRPDMQPFCQVGTLADPIEGSYGLIACIEVLEHMPESEAKLAIRSLCRATDTILFSSTPSDFTEPTHVNVRPMLYWVDLFWEQGFSPDVRDDVSFVASHALLLRRGRAHLTPATAAVFAEGLQAQAEFAKLQGQVQSLEASPGWQLIQKYRAWLDSSRARRPGLHKLVDRSASLFLKTAVAAKPESSGPAQAPPAIDRFQIASDTGFSYQDWIREQEPDEAALAAQRSLATSFSYQPKISIVVPIYKVPLEILKETIGSVAAQTYGNWELCLAHADPESTEARQYLTSLAEMNPRVKLTLVPQNRGISGNSNEAFALATGEFIGLLDHDDTLAPFALFEMVQALNRQPDLDFLYSDRDELTHPGAGRVDPLLKPQWSPEIMLIANYLTHFNVIAAKHLREIGGWRQETDGAQDWDLFLRAIERAKAVHHIPKILYHWRQIGTSVAGSGLAAKPYAQAAQLRTVVDHCRRQVWKADVKFDPDRGLRILWQHPREQKISVIVVPGSADAEMAPYAARLLADCDLPPAEIVLPVAQIVLPAAAGIPPQDPRIRIVQVPEGTSLAEKLTRAVESSIGDVLVFIDPAVTPANPEWLGELAGPLQNSAIGIVGARLLKPASPWIRHCGLIFTHGYRLEYIFAGEAQDIDAEFGSPLWYRNWSAVSGACFSMRRETLNAIGGFQAPLRYPRLDVDLCLRVRFEAGLRVLYNPYAVGFQGTQAALERWLWSVSQESADRYIRQCLPDGDPYFHPKLTCRNGKVWLRSRAGF